MITLDLHKRTKSEAQILLTSFLHEEHEKRSQSALIIFGYGKNILSELVIKEVNSSKYVLKYEKAHPSIGGAGAIVVFFYKKNKN